MLGLIKALSNPLGLVPHHFTDLLYWLAFFGGQLLFILKRADLAVRSPLNAVNSKWQYFTINWVPLLIRTFIEFVVIYTPYRDIPSDKIIAAFGWNIPLKIPQSWVVAAALGYLSDSLMDWGAMQEKILGIKVPSFIKETIPHLPEVQAVVAVIAEQNGKDT
jgi:hypothetical protein